MQKSYSLEELAQQIGATIRGNANVLIDSIAPLDKAQPNQLTFISNIKFRDLLAQSQAGILVVSENDVEFCSPESNLLIVKDPYVAYAVLAQYMDSTPKAAAGIAASAVISATAKLGENVSIGANTVIEDEVELGDNVIIGAGCFIGKGAKIGANTQLWANVNIYHQVQIGEHCLIQSGAVIGSDGFGYANDKGRWIKIP
ncbi:UDP-3-O-(3-hydroxymyristoyl)glucosamine N-acyltransferase, partial [Avibacterium paragallinarum]